MKNVKCGISNPLHMYLTTNYYLGYFTFIKHYKLFLLLVNSEITGNQSLIMPKLKVHDVVMEKKIQTQ